MEYYSAIQKNTFKSVPMMWMEPEPIIQSEVSQKVKHKCSILMYVYVYVYIYRVSLVAQWQRIRLQMQETQVQSLIQEDPPGEGNGNPLQCSCLGNPVDKGAWRDTVRGVAESQT